MINNLFKRHQSLFYALSIFLLLTGWLASGYLPSSGEPKTSSDTDTPERSLVQKVRVRVPGVSHVVQEIVLNGRTVSARAVTLRAEVEGQIASLAPNHGAVVHKGDLIAQFDKRDRQARLAEAHAKFVSG